GSSQPFSRATGITISRPPTFILLVLSYLLEIITLLLLYEVWYVLGPSPRPKQLVDLFSGEYQSDLSLSINGNSTSNRAMSRLDYPTTFAALVSMRILRLVRRHP